MKKSVKLFLKVISKYNKYKNNYDKIKDKVEKKRGASSWSL